MNNMTLTAIWDFSKTDDRLGSFIIFQEELLQFCLISQVATVDLYFGSTDRNKSLKHWEIIANLNPAIKTRHFLNHELPWRDWIKGEKLTWPKTDIIQNSSYTGSTLEVQQLWKQTGRIINLLSPEPEIQRANSWMRCWLDGKVPIAVHLKSNPLDPQSNANQNAWAVFFKDCHQKEIPVIFVLIGSDKIKDNIRKLPNTVVTKDFGGDLSLDFAIIQQSAGFMGMSSGPCNLAIMSSKPYLIWKHPNHHLEEMEKEFQDMDGFIFATKGQKFFREFDTSDHITNHFTPWYTDHVSNWERLI